MCGGVMCGCIHVVHHRVLVHTCQSKSISSWYLQLNLVKAKSDDVHYVYSKLHTQLSTCLNQSCYPKEVIQP